MVEFAPTVLERFGLKESRRKLHKVLFVFTGLGCLLPMMHQSSMGTVVVLLGYKLSPLWQSQMLTVFFLITAITIGFAVVVFESILSSVAFKRPFDLPILGWISGIMVWFMVLFLGIRAIDLLRLGAWPLAFAGNLKAVSFWIEIAFGLASIAALMPKANRFQPRMIFLGATAMLLNGAVYRLNCYLIGYDPGQGWTYFPSMGEILVTLMIFAIHVAAYLVLVKQLPVLHAVRSAPAASQQP
jgi:Ni/Fe-hydrogenase subunit HybB-like protein